jgi:hypothetical protein
MHEEERITYRVLEEKQKKKSTRKTWTKVRR